VWQQTLNISCHTGSNPTHTHTHTHTHTNMSEAQQLQREKEITTIMEATAARLTKERVNDTDAYEATMREVEEGLKKTHGIVEMEMDGDPLERDAGLLPGTLWIRWDQDEIEEYNEIEGDMAYDEEDGRWEFTAGGFTM